MSDETKVVAGWYPEGDDETQLRYWDGSGWTLRRRKIVDAPVRPGGAKAPSLIPDGPRPPKPADERTSKAARPSSAAPQRPDGPVHKPQFVAEPSPWASTGPSRPAAPVHRPEFTPEPSAHNSGSAARTDSALRVPFFSGETPAPAKAPAEPAATPERVPFFGSGDEAGTGTGTGIRTDTGTDADTNTDTDRTVSRDAFFAKKPVDAASDHPPVIERVPFFETEAPTRTPARPLRRAGAPRVPDVTFAPESTARPTDSPLRSHPRVPPPPPPPVPAPSSPPLKPRPTTSVPSFDFSDAVPPANVPMQTARPAPTAAPSATSNVPSATNTGMGERPGRRGRLIASWVFAVIVVALLVLFLTIDPYVFVFGVGAVVLVTGAWIAFLQRRSWMRLPPSRPIGVLLIIVAFAVMVAGSTGYNVTHPFLRGAASEHSSPTAEL